MAPLKKLLIEDIKDAFADGRAQLGEPALRTVRFRLGGTDLTADGIGRERLYVSLPGGTGTAVPYEAVSVRTLMKIHKIICQ